MDSKKKILSQGAGFDAAENFDNKKYSGGSAGQTITGVGFQPDLIIGKRLDNTEHWYVVDVARTGSMFTTLADTQISFRYVTPNADGFVVNGTGGVHNTGSLIAYCWKGGGSTVTNNDGDITSNVSANVKGGVSIVEYQGVAGGVGLGGQTKIGHGLSQAPELVVYKAYSGSNADEWYHVFYDGSNYKTGYWSYNFGLFNQTNSFTSTTVQTYRETNQNLVAYCFHSVPGFQKIGQYTASNSWGTSVSINVGFPPRFVMVKSITNAGDWMILDDERVTNGKQDRHYINQRGPSASDTSSSFSGNTFNITFGSTGNQGTANSSKYFYWAMA